MDQVMSLSVSPVGRMRLAVAVADLTLARLGVERGSLAENASKACGDLRGQGPGPCIHFATHSGL